MPRVFEVRAANQNSMSEVITFSGQQLADYAENNWVPAGEIEIIKDYIAAINEANAEKLNLYNSFGPSIRHRILNMNQYLHNLKFGFEQTDLNEHDWLRRSVFKEEEIEFRTKYDNAFCGGIKLGKSPNGKWTYGYNFNFGGGGSSSGCSVFGQIFETRQGALDHALQRSLKEYERHLNDTGEYRRPEYIRAVIAVINAKISDTKQLSLF